MKRIGLAIISIIIAIIITACAPTTTSILNDQFGDGARLQFARAGLVTACDPTPGSGLCFDPGAGAAIQIAISVLGDPVQSIGDACERTDSGAVCRFEQADAPTFVTITGNTITASVTYKREAGGRPYQEFAISK